MNYLKELSLNDIFDIQEKTENKKSIYKVQSNEKTNFALQIVFK
jgi:hypothetical protein